MNEDARMLVGLFYQTVVNILLGLMLVAAIVWFMRQMPPPRD